jgi:hypothetical protein
VFVLKVTWTDFVSLTFIRHFFNHSWISFKLVRSLCVHVMWVRHHGMARPQAADGGTDSNMEGSCE